MKLNKTVFLRERKRHTAHCAASVRWLGGGGTYPGWGGPSLARGSTYSSRWVPTLNRWLPTLGGVAPGCGQTDACENSTFPYLSAVSCR